MSDEKCCGACGYPVHATKEMACDWCRQSTDRIEALIAMRNTMSELWAKEAAEKNVLAGRCEDREAKLALMTTERDEAWKRAAYAEKMWGEAEVKLAKAVEALQWCAMYGDGDVALATLAELKGESHD